MDHPEEEVSKFQEKLLKPVSCNNGPMQFKHIKSNHRIQSLLPEKQKKKKKKSKQDSNLNVYISCFHIYISINGQSVYMSQSMNFATAFTLNSNYIPWTDTSSFIKEHNQKKTEISHT